MQVDYFECGGRVAAIKITFDDDVRFIIVKQYGVYWILNVQYDIVFCAPNFGEVQDWIEEQRRLRCFSRN